MVVRAGTPRVRRRVLRVATVARVVPVAASATVEPAVLAVPALSAV
jgi:hypothetical protein